MLIISHKSTPEFKDFLKVNGIAYMETIDNPNLDPRITDHPDLSIFKLDSDNLIIDKNVCDYYKSYLPGVNIIAGDEVGSTYPYDSIYNVYQGSDFFIHNDTTERSIESLLVAKEKKHMPVKQGYVRCSIIPMGDKILTSDFGMYKSLKNDLNIVLLEPENISLDGFPTGFIGGCCGLINDTLIFNGDISKLNNYEIIKREASESNLKLLYPTCDLVDTGSHIYIKGL